MESISRRNFIAAAGTAASVALAGCASSALADAAAGLVPGTYTGTADGISSAVSVTVTVADDGTISDVMVDSSGETAEIGAAAADDLAGQLFAAGSADIDGVSGATITSGAAKKAMKEALKQAASGQSADGAAQTGDAASADPGSPSWLGVKPEITDDMCVETVDCELLVVGSGTAGHFAAMNTVRLGGAPLIIDKAEVGLGIRYQMGAINTKIMQSAGIEIDRNEITRDFSRYSNCWNDPKLVHLWYDNSAEPFDFYDDLCREAGLRPHLMKFATNEENALKGFVECNEVLKDRDLDLDPAQVVESYVEENGGTFRYNTSMVELIQDENGSVTGVYATNESGDYIRINAEKGVIMATGGYAHNREMMRALQPQAAKVYAGERAPITNQGDGIKACLWAGAIMDDTHSAMIFERGAIKPDQAGKTDDGQLFWMGSQPFLKVNLNGERFMNEYMPYDYVLHTASTQPHHTYATVWDSNYPAYCEKFDTHGCSRLFLHENGAYPVFPMEMVMGMNEELIAGGYIVKADTIEELGEKLGLPVDTFKATVARYNELYAKGVDEDFGKEAYRLSAMDTAPFYGVRQAGGYLIHHKYNKHC